jgi:sugar phosphate isomerase/epimerase
MLSITTDYMTDAGCPEPYLRRIAEAGFSHVHWCHQWNTDFLYDECEIEQIEHWLHRYGLLLTDLHASAGREKAWGSPREYEHLAGVELVANRIAMAARLGSDVIIMHLPDLKDPATHDAIWQQVRRSLDALQGIAGQHGVRIAIENGPFTEIDKVLSLYAPDYLGLCYDCGHGNLIPDGLDWLDRLKDRLISIHLHDNDGSADQHNLPFWPGGTVNWDRLACILARSAYAKCVSLESTMKRSGMTDEPAWLAQGLSAGTQIAAMIESRRPSPHT